MNCLYLMEQRIKAFLFSLYWVFIDFLALSHHPFLSTHILMRIGLNLVILLNNILCMEFGRSTSTWVQHTHANCQSINCIPFSLMMRFYIELQSSYRTAVTAVMLSIYTHVYHYILANNYVKYSNFISYLNLCG